MTKKINFQLEGITFQVSDKHLQTTNWNGGLLEKPVLRINQTAAANIIKQYVKKTYPQATVYTSSDSYSMGNSVNVYLTDEKGNPMPKEMIQDVNRFGEQFVYGSFNGMIDMYEIKEGRRSDNGTYDIDMGVKYLFVNDRPKHATLPDVYRMLSQMTSEDCPYVFGQVDLETAVRHAMSFGATQKNCEKAIAMMA
jgi:hypothetical protein